MLMVAAGGRVRAFIHTLACMLYSILARRKREDGRNPSFRSRLMDRLPARLELLRRRHSLKRGGLVARRPLTVPRPGGRL